MQKNYLRASSATLLGSLLSLSLPLVAFADTESVRVSDSSNTTVAELLMPRRGISASEIAVLVNDHDPQSVEVANYYQQKRGIPAANMIHLNFDETKIYPGFTVNNGLDPAEFATLKTQ